MKLTLFHLEGEKQKNMNVLIGKFKTKKFSFFYRKTLVKINAIPQTRKTVYSV